jgi:hypothetical protein
MAAGDLLLEAKAQLPHGQWAEWLEANCAASARTARAYMQLAKQRAEVEAKMAESAIMTVDAALQFLASADAEPQPEFDLLELSIGQLVQLKLWRIHNGIRLRPTGLELPDDLTEDQWVKVGKVLRELPRPDWIFSPALTPDGSKSPR